MRHDKPQDHGNGHFWPAYVDALTNVILNLLFFVAVMVVCVFSLGMGASEKANEFISLLKLLSEKPAGAELRFQVTPQTDIEPPSRPASVQINPERVDQTQKLRFSFQAPSAGAEGDPVQASEGQTESLRKALVNKVATSRAQIRVWVECECREPLERRVAYLHIMSVRNTLLAMGAAPEKISMRMVTEEVKVNNPNAVFIEWETTSTVE